MKLLPAFQHSTHPARYSLTRDDAAALALAAIVACYAAAVLAAFGYRSYFGYGTETDFVGSMIGEAQRLISGEPLESRFHPPGYTFVLAEVYLLSGDWFTAGKIISAVSGIIAILASYMIFRRLLGAETGIWTGLGAVVGLVCSSTFLAFSLQATSDIYFLSLFLLSMLAALTAFQRNGSLAMWASCGALVALATMTRTNGITLLLLLALPFFQTTPVPQRLRSFATAALAAAVVFALFLAFASATGSSLFPEGTYKNLAASYFSAERVSWEGIVEADARFDSLTAVLLHDPLAIVQQYLKDMAKLAVFGLAKLAGPVLVLLALPGALLMLKDRSGFTVFIFAIVAIAQVGLVNFKAFEPRLYLFILPWIGAAAAYALFRVSTARLDRAIRWPALLIAAALIAGSFAIALGSAARFATTDNGELVSAVPEIEKLAGPGDMIVARKPHLSFYTGAGFTYLPQAADPAELAQHLEKIAAETAGTVYVFWGRIEKDLRPEIAEMLAEKGATPWLVPEAGTSTSSTWTLFRFQRRIASGQLIK